MRSYLLLQFTAIQTSVVNALFYRFGQLLNIYYPQIHAPGNSISEMASKTHVRSEALHAHQIQ